MRGSVARQEHQRQHSTCMVAKLWKRVLSIDGKALSSLAAGSATLALTLRAASCHRMVT